MDALVIGAFLPRPTHFLARGDAFKNSILAKVFKAYFMLPVYRASEGKENIEKNFETFDASYLAVNDDGMVLIFVEGLCKNNWELRPLKKGAARIAHRAWTSSDKAKELVIVPVGLTYEHFNGGGKSLIVNYGMPITSNQLKNSLNHPTFAQQLNQRIKDQLEQLAYINEELEINKSNYTQFAHTWINAELKGENVLPRLKQIKFDSRLSNFKIIKRWVTPLHYGLIAFPHYWAMQIVTSKLTKGSVFYDSILFGLTLFLFPFYWMVFLLLVLYFI